MNRLPRLLVALFLCLASLASRAAVPSIEDVWRLPAYLAPSLSDNGQYLAVTMPVKGRMNLAVLDLATRKAQVLTGYDDYDVEDVHWVGNERLVFSLGQFNTPGGDLETLRQGGLFSITREGKDFRVLAPTVKWQVDNNQRVRFMGYLHEVRGSDTDILAWANDRSSVSQDVYRVDLRTGEKTLLTFDRPDRVGRWLVDHDGVPRVAFSSVKDEPIQIVSYRASATAPWVELHRHGILEEAIVPIAIQGDELIVSSNVGRDTAAVYRYDPKTRKLGEMLAQHPRYDLTSVVEDRATGRVVGFRVNGAKPDIAWIDEAYARRQKAVDAALPDTYNVVETSLDGKNVLISAYSDRRVARWYLFDQEKRTLEDLLVSRPWLTPDKMVAMQPVFYRTRDGFEQLAYLMLPNDRKAGERLPMVVHIHGGPWARAEYWGRLTFGAREGQLLANRGYAVLFPQFRATPGFGRKQFVSSQKQFGKTMQEDIEDATDWAIKEGYADAGRICLSGASYGGYATLMGLAKTPDKYRCGIAGLAVTDIGLLMTSDRGDIPFTESSLKYWKAMAGDPDKDRDALKAVSPVYLADRIKAPVLIYSGTDDYRVPLEQMQHMRAALAKQGRSVVWIQKDYEQHGYAKLENNVELYTGILDFLEKNIGAKAGR
jgi:dipeptidyl aminopeptidase/acylaminoacyl peptidase